MSFFINNIITNKPNFKSSSSSNPLCRIPVAEPDCFVSSTPEILRHLKSIQLKQVINKGKDAVVYHTNFPDYVVRLKNGKDFAPEKLEPIFKNPLIIAADNEDSMRVMKYVKGKPLYGNNWIDTFRNIEKEDKYAYYTQFNQIKNLPDETFAQYIRDVGDIRKSGYDIDSINPNNFLLDGNHINIVDLEKKSTEPTIKTKDFSPFINEASLISIVREMSFPEAMKFADDIKMFYDRLINISHKEGYDISLPEPNHSKLQGILTYLYYKDETMLKIYTEK